LQGSQRPPPSGDTPQAKRFIVAKIRIFGLMLVVALVGLFTGAAKAQILVGRCGAGTQYLTIQAAVNAASSGSVIKICPGNYLEQVVIEKPLTLEGIISQGGEGVVSQPPAKGLVTNDLTWAAKLLVKNTSGVTLSNLIVDAAANPPACLSPALIGIVFHNASGTVTKTAVRNQASNGSGVCSGVGFLATVDNQQAQTVTLENSDFRNIFYTPIYAVGPGLTMNTLNNYVAGADNVPAGATGISYQSGAAGTIQGNTVANQNTPTANLPTLAAQGIDVVCASATVSGNTVVNTQVGILVGCPQGNNLQGNSTVTMNKIFETHKFDGIYVYSGVNSITKNSIVGAGASGIHLDTTQGSVNNVVSGNTVTESCAGILTTGTGSNKVSGNTFNALYVPTLNAATCGPIF
jgi:parallel beta-helix repeat protein